MYSKAKLYLNIVPFMITIFFMDSINIRQRTSANVDNISVIVYVIWWDKYFYLQWHTLTWIKLQGIMRVHFCSLNRSRYLSRLKLYLEMQLIILTQLFIYSNSNPADFLKLLFARTVSRDICMSDECTYHFRWNETDLTICVTFYHHLAAYWKCVACRAE